MRASTRAWSIESRAGMVFARRVVLEIASIEIHVPQVAFGVAQRLVGEMGGLGIAAFASGGDGFGADVVGEFDDGEEAVAAGAVHLLGAGIRAGAEGG